MAHEDGDTDSLAAAYRLAQSEDTIAIRPGTYVVDYLRDFGIVSDKALTVLGAGTSPDDVVVTSEITYFLQSRGLTIRSVTFEGGAVPLSVEGGLLDVRDCVFRDNRGGAVYCSGQDVGTFTNCTFVRNGLPWQHGATDGAISADRPLRVVNCSFYGNMSSHSGAAIFGAYDVHIEQCKFALNEAPAAAAVSVLSYGSAILSSTFYGNIGKSAIEIDGDGDTMSFHNVIVANTVGGSGLLCEGYVLVQCSAFWGNEFYAIEECLPDAATLVFADPLFCDPDRNDFRLKAGSPCLPPTNPNGPDCGVIGAFGQGCEVNPTLRATWGSVKARFGGR